MRDGLRSAVRGQSRERPACFFFFFFCSVRAEFVEAIFLWPQTAPIVFPTRSGVPHIHVGRGLRTTDSCSLASQLLNRHIPIRVDANVGGDREAFLDDRLGIQIGVLDECASGGLCERAA